MLDKIIFKNGTQANKLEQLDEEYGKSLKEYLVSYDIKKIVCQIKEIKFIDFSKLKPYDESISMKNRHIKSYKN